MSPKLDTYEREDRGKLSAVLGGLEDVIVFAEALVLAEKYGLSVQFDSVGVEWTCIDPWGCYTATANTPAGAILFWDCKRQDKEGRNEGPKMHLVSSRKPEES